MAKEINAIISDKMVGEVVKTIKEISEESMEMRRKTEIEKATMKMEAERCEKEKFKDQEDMMKEEFDRVYKELKKVKPGSNEYHALLENIKAIKAIITGNSYY